MKALILSTKTGEGHNSASKAIAESLSALGCEVVLDDILKTGQKNVSRPVSGLYVGLTTHAPWFFGMLYHAGELVSSSRRHSPIYYLNALYWKSLLHKIEQIKPDVILCPHIFSAQAVTFLRLRHGLAIPAAGLVTDYSCSPFWEETQLDKYIIPSPGLTGEFTRKGVPAQKLVPIGIPVSARFCTTVPKQQARAAFGLHSGPVFVLMGGSMGFGHLSQLAQAILSRMPSAQVVTVCAENSALLEKTERLGLKNLIALGYVENISALMDAADVLLTKPGGLSATEALSKRVPVVFTDPIPGGEEQNARFISALGASVFAQGVVPAADAAVALMKDPARRTAMCAAQERHFPHGTAERVARLLISLGGGAQL